MALRIYNPKTQTFGAFNHQASDLPLDEVLLLNILIELQTISHMLGEQSPGLPSSTVESVRIDAVSN